MKKFLAILLTLLMVLPVFSVMVVAEAAPDQNAEPGSEAYTAWLKSEGYTAISNFNDFKTSVVANPAGKYYLTADIVDNFGDDFMSTNFTGAIDGNGYTFYNWKSYITGGAITGTLKNITVSKYTSADETTAITGANWSLFCKTLGNGAVIENIVNYRDCGEVGNYYGVFAREVNGGTVIFRNCKNYGDMASPYSSNNHGVGGFLGAAWKGSTVEFYGCENYGDITASAAGGFIGMIEAKSEASCTLKFVDCYNGGTITGTAGSSAYGLSGGFVGAPKNGDAANAAAPISITFDGCTNEGDVLRADKGSNSRTARQGGLVGYLIMNDSYALTLNINNCTVANCTISGKGSNNTAEWGEAAGLVGKIKAKSADTKITVKNCTVSNVNVDANEGKFAFVRVAAVDTVVLENCVANNVVNAEGAEVAVTQKDNDGKIVLKFTEESNVVSINKAQQSVADAEGKSAVRFIGTVNSLGFAELGYYIELNGKTIKLTTDVVYNSLNANYGESQITAESLNAAYLTAIVMKDVTADFNGTINVTPFVKAEDGTYTYGKTKSISFTNGAIGECL